MHYFNFEEDKALASIFAPNFKVPRILDDLSLYQNKEIGLDDLIIFDEIQAAPSALTSLKYFCETRPEGYVVAAGSLLGIHLFRHSRLAKLNSLTCTPSTLKNSF